MSKKLTWHIEQRKISELKVWDKNPRYTTDKDKADLDKSIKKFDYVEVVIININNTIIGGHQRIDRMKEAGRQEEVIDVRVPNRKLSDKEFDELAVRLNKNRGQWDDNKLRNLFESDELKNWGFDEHELNDIFDQALEIKEDDFNLEEELAKIKKPFTQPGDVYILGDHKLLCGNCKDLEKVSAFMGKDRAGVVYCDPPYNIGLSYHKGIKGNSNKKTYTNKVFNDSLKPDKYLKWLKGTIINALSVSHPDVHVFYWCDPKFIGIVQVAFSETGIKNKSVCFWIKNQFNPVIQMAFNRVTEPCIYGTFGKPHLNTNITNLSEILNKEVTGTDIHESIEEIIDMWMAHRDNTADYVHPTQKPIALHEKPLKRCSAPGSIVVDFFGGSGSTLISCEQLKRKARLTEEDPVFCDVIVQRWERFTGKKAQLIRSSNISNGKSGKKKNTYKEKELATD